MFDGWLTDVPGMLVPPAATPEEVAWVDVVMASHEHGDHLDGPTFERIAAASSTPAFVVPHPIRALAIGAGVDGTRVLGAAPDEPIAIGTVAIHPIPACHGVEPEDAYDFGEARSSGRVRYLGYVVDIDGVRVYHAGDTIVYPGMVERLAALRPDIAFLPINGRDASREAAGIVGNMTEEEAATLAVAIGVSAVVPMHYDVVPTNTGSAATFVTAMARIRPSVTVVVPGAGARFLVGRPAEATEVSRCSGPRRGRTWRPS
jgi:L-ascorbate metabolism protein UlaG (beta-lactamase superfamily)